MKKIILWINVVTFLVLTSCAPKILYSWRDYNDASYYYLKFGDKSSADQLINTYQQIIEKQEGTRNTVPPGIYADYGFILIQNGKNEEGKAMLKKEIALYPESEIFINRISMSFN